MFGNYASWSEAAGDADSYADPAILARVRDSLRRVRDGAAVFERDGVIFDRVEYSLALIAGLLHGANLGNGALDVLDYGGSLGSSFFQCRRFLKPLRHVRWSVVEQPTFAAVGRAEFETEQLRFFDSTASCFAVETPRVLLLLSVLQFLPEPETVVAELLQHAFDLVIVDRTPMWDEPTRITRQHVPADVYGRPIKYPAWIFNRVGLTQLFSGYDVLTDFKSDDGPIWTDGHTGWHGGFVFTKESRR